MEAGAGKASRSAGRPGRPPRTLRPGNPLNAVAMLLREWMEGPPVRTGAALIKSLSPDDFESGQAPHRDRVYDMLAGDGLTLEFIDAVAKFCFPDTAMMLEKISEARALWPKPGQYAAGEQDALAVVLEREQSAQRRERSLWEAVQKAREGQHQAEKVALGLQMLADKQQERIAELERELFELRADPEAVSTRALRIQLDRALAQQQELTEEKSRAYDQRDEALRVAAAASSELRRIREQLRRMTATIEQDTFPAIPEPDLAQEVSEELDAVDAALQHARSVLDVGRESVEAAVRDAELTIEPHPKAPTSEWVVGEILDPDDPLSTTTPDNPVNSGYTEDSEPEPGQPPFQEPPMKDPGLAAYEEGAPVAGVIDTVGRFVERLRLQRLFTSATNQRVFNLVPFDTAEATTVGSDLRTLITSAETMEEASQATINYFRSAFVDVATGRPVFALTRMFHTFLWEDLSPDLRTYVKQRDPDAVLDQRYIPFLVLLGTGGDHPHWSNRHVSRDHKVVPLSAVDVVRRAPLALALLDRVLQSPIPRAVTTPSSFGRLIVPPSAGYVGNSDVFLVPEAFGSPYVPTPQFVRDYKIRSAVAIGGWTGLAGRAAWSSSVSRQAWVALLYSRVPISENMAPAFRAVANELHIALDRMAGTPIFKTVGPSLPAG